MIDKLQKWAKHVKQWDASDGPRWTRRQSSRGGFVWQTPCGQKKYELRPPVTAELERQQTNQQGGKTLSRVTKPVERKPSANPEMDERKRKMDALAAKLRGEQVPEVKAGAQSEEEHARQKKARREAEAAAAKDEAGERGERREGKREKKERGEREGKGSKESKEERRARRKAEKAAIAAADEEEMEEDEDEEESDESAGEEEKVLDEVIGKCDATAAKMRKELAPLLNAEGRSGQTLAQPRLMSTQLTMAPHQLIGVSWLHGLRKHGASGILADDMGLGKTVQTIALLAQVPRRCAAAHSRRTP